MTVTRSALVALAVAACHASDAAPSAGLRIEAEGPPKCDFIMTVPLPPAATATRDASGKVHLVVYAYVQVPVTANVAAAKGELAVEVTSTAKDEPYCELPFQITGAASTFSSVLVRVHHGGGRDVTELHAKIR
jgi:hypothetical protein